LEVFIQKIRSSLNIQSEPIEIPDPRILSQQFETNRMDIKQKCEVLQETALQATYFPKLQKCGDIILEDTKGTLLPTTGGGIPEEGGEFRKLNFANRSETTKFPDLTLRLPAPPSATFDDPGPAWRLCPWAVVGYLDLKATDVSVESHSQQGLYYAQSTLLCCPTREYCLTAIYNFHSLIFCAVKSIGGSISYFTSGVIHDSAASVQIAKFLSCPPGLLGYVNWYPFDLYPPIAALGRGSTAICVSVRAPEVQGIRAMKVSRDSVVLSHEVKILNYLHTQTQQLSSETPLPWPRVLESTEHYTLMEPVYGRPHSTMSLIQFLKAWDALREVHKLGITHCDVRMPNLGVIGKTKAQTFHWLDWSAARPFRRDLLEQFSNSLQVGSTCTASISVLRRMMEKKHDYQCFPSDEGISMIYLCWQQLCGTDNLKNPRTPKSALSLWEDEATAFPPTLAEAVTNLQRIGERSDEEALEEINGHVRSALSTIFSMEATL
jgi:hypothetical protein